LVVQWQGCELKESSNFYHLGENDKSSCGKWRSADPEIFSSLMLARDPLPLQNCNLGLAVSPRPQSL